MQWLIPLVTAVWAVWKWSTEHDQDRARERGRMAALYVNPFLSACEDAQSRIYHILAADGLKHLRQRYPDGSFAEETVYLIVRLFGWLATVLRYGPYTGNPEVIRLAERLRDAFATSALPIGAFTIFRPEQKALGKTIMTRFEGQFGVELDTIAFYEFKELLRTGALAESPSLAQSIQALREADSPDDLDGRERLIRAQSTLVDLLDYMEAKEGFYLFAGERRRCGVETAPSGGESAGYRGGDPDSVVSETALPPGAAPASVEP